MQLMANERRVTRDLLIQWRSESEWGLKTISMLWIITLHGCVSWAFLHAADDQLDQNQMASSRRPRKRQKQVLGCHADKYGGSSKPTRHNAPAPVMQNPSHHGPSPASPQAQSLDIFPSCPPTKTAGLHYKVRVTA